VFIGESRELSNVARYLKGFLLQVAVGYFRGGAGCGEVILEP